MKIGCWKHIAMKHSLFLTALCNMVKESVVVINMVQVNGLEFAAFK